ncbi:MAG TPA: hypothetical protein VFI27_15810 [candidate division Zixibacteria bacterium]|nr:hypothetical protein [candidate division Zixibacteria bacterium]
MTSARRMMILKSIVVTLLLMTIGSGCFLQPINTIEREFNFIDMDPDTPALRLARPVKAELLKKDENGKWVPAGVGIIPAGAYIKGRAPKENIE